MHGQGHRRNCPSCGQSVTHLRDVLANCELRGPREITSSNVDRIFDDGGKRFLVIEEKNWNEPVAADQIRMLRALASVPRFDVWGVRGDPDDLTISRILPNRTVGIAAGEFDIYQAAVDAWFERRQLGGAA